MHNDNLFLFVNILGIDQLKLALSNECFYFIISMAMVRHDATLHFVVMQFLKNHEEDEYVIIIHLN